MGLIVVAAALLRLYYLALAKGRDGGKLGPRVGPGVGPGLGPGVGPGPGPGLGSQSKTGTVEQEPMFGTRQGTLMKHSIAITCQGLLGHSPGHIKLTIRAARRGDETWR